MFTLNCMVVTRTRGSFAPGTSVRVIRPTAASMIRPAGFVVTTAPDGRRGLQFWITTQAV